MSPHRLEILKILKKSLEKEGKLCDYHVWGKIDILKQSDFLKIDATFSSSLELDLCSFINA